MLSSEEREAPLFERLRDAVLERLAFGQSAELRELYVVACERVAARERALELLTKGQVAAMLGVLPSTVDRWVRAGRLVAAEIGTGEKGRRFTRRSVLAFVVEAEARGQEKSRKLRAGQGGGDDGGT